MVVDLLMDCEFTKFVFQIFLLPGGCTQLSCLLVYYNDQVDGQRGSSTYLERSRTYKGHGSCHVGLLLSSVYVKGSSQTSDSSQR